MPWIKISVAVFGEKLSETTSKDSFICGKGDGGPIEKELAREILVELVRCFKEYNRDRQGT